MTQDQDSSSPLDAFLARFLSLIAERERGFVPGPQSEKIAGTLGQPRAFIDMLFTSARMRGLIKPSYGSGNKIVWKVSPAGLALTERQKAQSPSSQEETQEPLESTEGPNRHPAQEGS